MTNLLASIIVCVVTNVMVTTDEQREPYGDVWYINRPVPGSVTKEATRSNEVVEVVEVMKIKVDTAQLIALGWAGGLIEAAQNRVLSRKERVWLRRNEWTEVTDK